MIIKPNELAEEINWANNTLISDELLDEYKICKQFPDDVIGIYRTFLSVTDYIPNKIIEAQLGGYELDKDYSPVIQARQVAREEISKGSVQDEGETN